MAIYQINTNPLRLQIGIGNIFSREIGETSVRHLELGVCKHFENFQGEGGKNHTIFLIIKKKLYLLMIYQNILLISGPWQGRGKRGGCLGRQFVGIAKIEKH
jgi:hypothetical protein